MSLHRVVACFLALHSAPALALNIVITNDDGLTANVRALHDGLKAEGHDVVVSVPCSEQSGLTRFVFGWEWIAWSATDT